jgi:transposase
MVPWACPGLTDIQDQGTWSLREDVHHHGERGKEAGTARRSFTPEFKAEIIELCQRGGRTVRQVSQDFDLTETAVREWVKQADLDSGSRSDRLSSDEKAELAQLRRETAGCARTSTSSNERP